jgi:16S rRNA (guanine527-N7)-methyltransferase
LQGACELSGDQITRLFGHYMLFRHWNSVLNLSSIADFESVVVRHYCESLFLSAKLPALPFSVADVGSGAGFPGIPVAVLHPEARVYLVESRQRKAAFLKEATRAMPNVEVRCQRAKDVCQGFDWLVSRAVAWEELRPVVLKTAAQVGLLSSLTDSTRIIADRHIVWRDPLPLPWGRQMVLLLGQVSRGT